MKPENIDAASAEALPVLDDATPSADRRAFDRDEPSRRQHPRVDLSAPARLRGASQGAVEAGIRNLSAGGCSLTVRQGRFAEGDLVTVKIDGVEPWPGRVQWSVDGQVGVAFDRPFYPAVFEAIVAVNTPATILLSAA